MTKGTETIVETATGGNFGAGVAMEPDRRSVGLHINMASVLYNYDGDIDQVMYHLKAALRRLDEKASTLAIFDAARKPSAYEAAVTTGPEWPVGSGEPGSVWFDRALAIRDSAYATKTLRDGGTQI